MVTVVTEFGHVGPYRTVVARGRVRAARNGRETVTTHGDTFGGRDARFRGATSTAASGSVCDLAGPVWPELPGPAGGALAALLAARAARPSGLDGGQVPSTATRPRRPRAARPRRRPDALDGPGPSCPAARPRRRPDALDGPGPSCPARRPRRRPGVLDGGQAASRPGGGPLAALLAARVLPRSPTCPGEASAQLRSERPCWRRCWRPRRPRDAARPRTPGWRGRDGGGARGILRRVDSLYCR